MAEPGRPAPTNAETVSFHAANKTLDQDERIDYLPFFAGSAAFDFFVETYGVKYDKAVAKLVKDREALLTFYDYPAEHWKHIRTSNPIESTFATVRHRTKRTKGCLSRRTGLAMAFKLMMSAQGKWRKLDGQNRLPEIIQGIEFRDGLRQLQAAA